MADLLKSCAFRPKESSCGYLTLRPNQGDSTSDPWGFSGPDGALWTCLSGFRAASNRIGLPVHLDSDKHQILWLRHRIAIGVRSSPSRPERSASPSLAMA